jgi:hypothetical protein
MNRNQLDGRSTITRDDDLFPALGCRDELGKVGLGVMDVDFHEGILARVQS